MRVYNENVLSHTNLPFTIHKSLFNCEKKSLLQEQNRAVLGALFLCSKMVKLWGDFFKKFFFAKSVFCPLFKPTKCMS